MTHPPKSQRSGLNRRPRHTRTETCVGRNPEIALGADGVRSDSRRSSVPIQQQSRNAPAIRVLSIGFGNLRVWR